MRILIVEDDPACRGVLRGLLERAGHQAVVASDGLSGMALLQHDPACRMVIADWQMPDLDGAELCQAIRLGDFSGHVYIILLTGPSAKQERMAGLSAGADDFITKPLDHAELMARLTIAERVLAMEARDVALFALAQLTEIRDPQAGAHLERLRAYAYVLAWHLSGLPAYQPIIDREFLRCIYAASPLHDIGKVAILDTILLKPGRLTPEEFEIMKTHSAIGAQTLQAALDHFPEARFLQMARDIAAGHHEKHDGSGYPAGLKGSEIPLPARIVSLADVYDALTTQRVYKPAFTHDLSKQMLLEGTGRDFDPDVVAAFLACEEQFIAISYRTSDRPRPTPAEPACSLVDAAV